MLWFWISLLIIVIILAILYFIVFYPGLQVKNVVISGNEQVKTQDLQTLILDNSTTGLLKFWNFDIVSKSILLLNINRIDKKILQKFPIIEKLTISRQFPQTITLGVTERKPIGIYCNGPEGNSQQCFLIDQNGIIFEPSGIQSGGLVIVRQLLQNNNLYTGENVVGQNVINSISEIQKDLKDNFQINMTEALITTPIRMDVTTDAGWKIYFSLDTDTDINSQLIKLNLLLNDKINPDVRKTLQYIDLRFKDRAFYK
jgi:cell division septal protein FtsQ